MKHLAPGDSLLWVVAQYPLGYNPRGPRDGTHEPHWGTGAQETPAPEWEEKEGV